MFKGKSDPSARNGPGSRSRARLAVAVVVLALVAGITLAPARSTPAQAAGGAPDASVAAWQDTLERAFAAAGQTPAEGMTYVGLMHYAIYDAVVTIKGQYEPLFYKASRQPNASAEAAVAAAARGVLIKVLPGQSTIIEAAYANALAGIPEGTARANGIKVGEGAAQAVTALPIVAQVKPGQPYTVPSPLPAGVYEPTSPAPAAVIGLWLSKATPTLMANGAQFRPSGTLPINSAGYAADFEEVRTIGSKTSSTRTAAQTEQAMFWSEPPVQQAVRSMAAFVKARNLDIVDAARFGAMIGATYQEGMLACFDAKYALPAWRPIHAIRRADTDSNPATSKEETWEPLLGTPNHPEYPSAHSCVSVGVAVMVEKFLGGATYEYNMISVASRPTRTFTSSAAFASDVAEARIYGGIHFRQATIDGAMIGRQVADYVAGSYFRPAAPSSPAPLPPNTGNAEAQAESRTGYFGAGAALLVAAAAYGLYRRRQASRR